MILTSLANVRSWVGTQSNSNVDDALLNRLINEASRTVMNYLQRADLGFNTIDEIISGRGESKIQLRNWPVLSVNSMSIDGVTIPASSGPARYGYSLETVSGSFAGRPQNVGIVGGSSMGSGFSIGEGSVSFGRRERSGPFSRGVNNVAVNYSFGYCVQNEQGVVPGASDYSVTPKVAFGSWSGDNGVSYQNGNAMIAVQSNPAQGQYVPPSVAGDNPSSTYTFSAADAGASVFLNYNIVPYDIEQAAIEVVGERYRYKGRIGEASKTMGGQETASYLVKDGLTASIKQRLDPYRLWYA
jgi:hypothetical protein